MKLRAAIFDVYGTLLEVGPPPPDGHALWEQLFHDTFNTSPPISRLDFSVACNRAITQRHDAAKARGVAFPEINWPSVVEEVIPAVSKLSREARDEFIFRQVQIGRSLKLFAGVGHGLRLLQQKGCALGIASNAQHYTLRELSEALSGDRVDLSVFDPDLCVWSFQNGFSKPNPHVFQILATRLEARGISPGQTLMVGDRLDNDVEPARAYGMQTWHLTNAPSTETASGDWSALQTWLRQKT